MPRPATPPGRLKGVIRQRPSGRWQVIITLPKDDTGTYPQLTATFDTEREAETWRLEQTDPRRRPLKERGMTLGELLGRYLDYHQDRLAATTIQTYRSFVKNWMNPQIGHLRLAKLTVDDIDDYYENVQALGLKPATIRQHHAILHTALAWGRKRRYVDLNVAVDAEPPSVKRKRITPPTPIEVQKLLAAAFELDDWFGVACRLAAATGARRGTVAAFRLSDFRFATREVLLDRSVAVVDGERIVKSLKWDNGDWVPVGQATLDIVASHVAALHERARVCGIELADDFYLFADDVDCVVPINPCSLTNRWNAVRATVGLPRVRFHDLRHYVATELLAAGFDPVTIAARLRWESAAMLYEVYGHSRPERATDASDHIERSLG